MGVWSEPSKIYTADYNAFMQNATKLKKSFTESVSAFCSSSNPDQNMVISQMRISDISDWRFKHNPEAKVFAVLFLSLFAVYI